MTDAQAAQIKEMRLKGMSYWAIADVLRLSRDIVRNHCKAKGLYPAAFPSRPALCGLIL